ncbi:MAG: nucleotidyltransferase family protein [Prevotellaceae bacterium]|jgi:predicted nucleotidyltransferase|nr:nucleotidyltransferase family protein [Prevotellaceae bacterium]
MNTTAHYLRKLQQFKQKYSQEYGIERIGIFGSVARGEQTENSDVDIYFEADKMSLFRMGGLMYDLREFLGTSVDLVHNTKKLNPRFRQQIEKDMIYV